MSKYLFTISESVAIALANENGTAAHNVTFRCREQNLSYHPLLTVAAIPFSSRIC